MPFLTRHSSLPQPHNIAAVEGMPGLDGYGGDPEGILPNAVKIDHSDLLRNQEFVGIVVRKLRVHEDMLSEPPAFIAETEELVRLIDQELEATT